MAVVCEGLGLTECRVSCAPICRTPDHWIPPLSIALEAATTARLALPVSEKAWLSLQSLWTNRSLCSSSVLGLLLEFVGGLFVLLTDFVELSHVLEEVGASLESDEKLGLLAIASVVGGLNCDGLGSDFLECGIVVPKTQKKIVSFCTKQRFKHVPIDRHFKSALLPRARFDDRDPTWESYV